MEVTLQEHRGVLFYTCPTLSELGFANGFSTRVGGVSPVPWDSLNLGAGRGDDPERVSENIRRFCTAVGADSAQLVKNKQVHGDTIRPVTKQDILTFPGEAGTVPADGLCTQETELALMVFSADCIPILLCDPKQRVCCAVHAGWRGTALGIAGKAAQQLQTLFGCHPQDLLAVIGPGISTCCFEVHQDVPDGILEHFGSDALPFIHPISNTEKYHVDLKGINQLSLRQAGLTETQIAVCPACTACDEEHFWSHRRQGTQRGSQAAVIQTLPL